MGVIVGKVSTGLVNFATVAIMPILTTVLLGAGDYPSCQADL